MEVPLLTKLCIIHLFYKSEIFHTESAFYLGMTHRGAIRLALKSIDDEDLMNDQWGFLCNLLIYV